MEDNIPQLPSDIINEDKSLIEYSSQKFCLKIKLKENTNDLRNEEKIIILTMEKENTIERFIFEKIMIFNDFKELGALFRLYLKIEEIYNFIVELLKEKNIIIKEIIHEQSLTLSLKKRFPGYNEPFSAEIKLLKKECNKDDLIDTLFKALEEKEKKNKYLEQIIEKIKSLEEKNEVIYRGIPNLSSENQDGYEEEEAKKAKEAEAERLRNEQREKAGLSTIDNTLERLANRMKRK